jgi:hypothetical protein
LVKAIDRSHLAIRPSTMTGFLRKKFALDSKPGSSDLRESSPSSSFAAPPPLFAKFATTYQDNKSNSTDAQSRTVSSPMPLANGARRRAESAEESPNSGARSQASGKGDSRGGRSVLSPHASDVLVDPTSSTQPMPRQPRLTDTAQHRPSNLPISRLVMDKPLPLPNPTPDGEDDLAGPKPALSPPFSTNIPQPFPLTEKPLPQPSITPPTQRQDPEYFPPKQLLTSTPVKHGPAYSVISPRVPNRDHQTKTVPPQPQEPPPPFPQTRSGRHARQPAGFEPSYDQGNGTAIPGSLPIVEPPYVPEQPSAALSSQDTMNVGNASYYTICILFWATATTKKASLNLRSSLTG